MTMLNNSVVHLTMRFDRTVLAIGTGVLYKFEDDYFIVTAWHNLSGRHTETLSALDKKNLALPNNVIVNFTVQNAYGSSRFSVVVPLVNDSNSLFYVHKDNYPRKDVAVLPFNPYQDHKLELYRDGVVMEGAINPTDFGKLGLGKVFPVQDFEVKDPEPLRMWWKYTEVTEELFIPGYPKNIQDYYSQPVWKRATIASSVQEGWNGEPKFLIDTASKSGMSGAPVLFYSPRGILKILGHTYNYGREICILAGIYVGRMHVDTNDDPQIGVVWNSSIINEIINDRNWEVLPEDLTVPYRQLLDETQKILGTCSAKGIQNILNDELPSRFIFRNQLLKAVNSRATPERALEAVLEAAEKYTGPLVQD